MSFKELAARSPLERSIFTARAVKRQGTPVFFFPWSTSLHASCAPREKASNISLFNLFTSFQLIPCFINHSQCSLIIPCFFNHPPLTLNSFHILDAPRWIVLLHGLAIILSSMLHLCVIISTHHAMF